MKVSYYHDAGHGWYRVSLKALKALGISDKVTAWSYRYGASVYLEEDTDAGLLFEALAIKGITPIVHRCKQESRCRVRSFESYRPE